MALPNWTVSVFRTPTGPKSAILGVRPGRRIGTKPMIDRRGALIVEAVIALVLLTTATVALTKLAKSSAALDRQSDQRLVATLAAENTIERLQGVASDKLSGQADQVAALVAQDAGCQIDVSTEPFTTGDREGIHVRVDASISPAIRVSLHDWRFAPESNGDSEDSTDNTAAKEGNDARFDFSTLWWANRPTTKCNDFGRSVGNAVGAVSPGGLGRQYSRVDYPSRCPQQPCIAKQSIR